MTVKELIAILKKYDKNMFVVIPGRDNNYYDFSVWEQQAEIWAENNNELLGYSSYIGKMNPNDKIISVLAICEDSLVPVQID